MFVIRETFRVLASIIGYGVQGRRVGLVVLAVLGVAAIALTGAVTSTIPLAIYPFL